MEGLSPSSAVPAGELPFVPLRNVPVLPLLPALPNVCTSAPILSLLLYDPADLLVGVGWAQSGTRPPRHASLATWLTMARGPRRPARDD